MKKITATVLILVLFIATNNKSFAQSTTKVKIILDSLEVLKKVGGFVDGYTNPPTKEEIRYYKITQMLFGLPYSNIRSLLRDKNKYLKVYGFSLLTRLYFDSLTKADLQIFGDTDKLFMYTQKGVVDAGITIGQYCQMAYGSVIEEHKLSGKKKNIEVSVKDFIKTHSQFPDSYQPISFDKFTWIGDGDDISFEIQHTYKLKQRNGKEIQAANYFILDKNFRVMLIEVNRSTTTKVDPPQIEEWMLKFGKRN